MIFRPYPHQAAGIEWILSRPACALFWGMGSGKTVTTLTAVDRILFDRLEEGPVLVIAPLRVAVHTWATEAAKWDHLRHLRVSLATGTAKERRAALQADADVYVINRENVQWLVEEFCEGGRLWSWPVVILDELSSFKSHRARRFRALRAVRGRIRRIIGLTGTPRPNGLEDLWAEIYLLDRGERLGHTIGGFRTRYLKPERMNGYVVYSYVPLPGAEEAVYGKLSDLCMSVRKEDVLSLPGQEYQDVLLTPPPALLKKYRQFERDKVLECLDGDGCIIGGTEAALTNKLLQFANGAVYDADHTAHTIHDLKLDALEELIEAAGGESVLVLYSFLSDRDRIRARIQCRDLRSAQDIEDWNAGRIPVALAHPASIGHGLNLQYGGHILIWFGLTWSLELYEQANERLHRPGQESVCRVYHLLMDGTHDLRVLDALKRKDAGQASAIDALRLDVLKQKTP